MNSPKEKRFKSYDQHQLWRSGLVAQLGLGFMSVDSWAVFPILLVIFLFNIYTLSIFSITVVFFVVLKLMNIPSAISLTNLKAFVAGKHRYIGNRKLRKGRFTHDR